MGVPQVGIEPQRKLQFRDGRAIFGVLEVSISEAGVADRGIRLQLSYFAELLNRHIQPALLRRRRPGLCVLDDFRSKTLQKKATGEERGSHDLPKSESGRSSRPYSASEKIVPLRSRAFNHSLGNRSLTDPEGTPAGVPAASELAGDRVGPARVS